MPNIFARSPFNITINEANQTETKIELRIWNGTGSAPVAPTYTLSKLIPSITNRSTTYNISPFIKEYLSHAYFGNNFSQDNAFSPNLEWCNVQVKKFRKITSSFVQVGSTLTYYGFDGYNLYTEQLNMDLGNYLLKPKTYYYYYDAGANLSAEPLKRAGSIMWYNPGGYKMRYTELNTGTVHTYTTSISGIMLNYRVKTSFYSNGNKLEILNASDVVQYTATFKPKTECKYTPVCCDFINRYGAWQREYFFKASKNSINIQNSEYNLMVSDIVTPDVLEGQRKTFNTNYEETITVNTDWVSEDFSDNLRELMTSERILLDNRPVKLNTKSIELQKQINTKMINYTLEFQYATDIINNVV